MYPYEYRFCISDNFLLFIPAIASKGNSCFIWYFISLFPTFLCTVAFFNLTQSFLNFGRIIFREFSMFFWLSFFFFYLFLIVFQPTLFLKLMIFLFFLSRSVKSFYFLFSFQSSVIIIIFLKYKYCFLLFYSSFHRIFSSVNCKYFSLNKSIFYLMFIF